MTCSRGNALSLRVPGKIPINPLWLIEDALSFQHRFSNPATTEHHDGCVKNIKASLAKADRFNDMLKTHLGTTKCFYVNVSPSFTEPVEHPVLLRALSDKI